MNKVQIIHDHMAGRSVIHDVDCKARMRKNGMYPVEAGHVTTAKEIEENWGVYRDDPAMKVHGCARDQFSKWYIEKEGQTASGV